MTTIKEFTAAISQAEKIPAGKVRKITKALLELIAEAIDKGEELNLPGLVFNPRTLPAKEADGDKPARPERNIATLRRRKPKVKKEDEQTAE